MSPSKHTLHRDSTVVHRNALVVNYSSTRVNWPLLAFYDWEGADSPLPYSENNDTVEVGQ